MKDIRDGVYGTILGQAIGDALGSQTEFHKSFYIRDLGPTWGYDFPAFSDDTQKMLATLHAILEGEPYPDHEAFMGRLKKAFIAYADGYWGTNDRSPGGTVMSGIRALRSGIPWTKSGHVSGKGNGSAMAAAGIGAAYWADPDYAFDIGCWTSVPTHNDWEAVVASGAVAFLVAKSIQNNNIHQAVADLFEQMENPSNRLAKYVTTGSISWSIKHLATAYAMANARVDFETFRRWNGNDGKGLEAVAAALFHNVRACRYSDVVINLANYTGDSDSTAAIGGAIAGARWGYYWIPRRWIRRVEATAMLHDYASKTLEFGVRVENEEDTKGATEGVWHSSSNVGA